MLLLSTATSMSRWDKLKVTELKDELKSRGIPLSGLKLKQQLINKLIEIESTHATTTQNDKPGASPESEHSSVEAKTRETSNPTESQLSNRLSLASEEEDQSNDGAGTEEVQIALALQAEGNPAIPKDSPQPIEIEDASEAKEVAKDDPFIPVIVEKVEDKPIGNEDENGSCSETAADENAQNQAGQRLPIAREYRTISNDNMNTSAEGTKHEDLSEQRKRKRRSATPPADYQDSARKRARSDSSEAQLQHSAPTKLERIQAATQQVENSRQANDGEQDEPIKPMIASSRPEATRVAKEVGSLPESLELQRKEKSESMADNITPRSSPEIPHNVAPAKHPATRSLYMRNFKRPLHIPTLRNYISALAKISPAASSEDPVKIFYLDSIRTHAFVSFDTVSAASRVRNAMHDTKYPDEPMREHLWVDFVPDEKVQDWIDEETGACKETLGASRTGRKFDVFYQQTNNGIEAILHDGSTGSMKSSSQQHSLHRPGPALTNKYALNTHSERTNKHPQQPAAKPVAFHPRSDAGKGFKALDELFLSTNTKPKLYYKLVDRAVINDRLDAIRKLRIGHSDMGKPGDEGMKRYTFSDSKDGASWVDKGPEFGFGRKGQERLAGHRGRGGMRGARRCDSWRGR